MRMPALSRSMQTGLWFSGLLALTLFLTGCGEPAAPPPGANTDTPEMKIDQGEEMSKEEAMNEKDVSKDESGDQ